MVAGRVVGYLVWLNDVRRIATERASGVGWRSAWAFLCCTWQAWYIQHRNKYCLRPIAKCPCCGWEGHSFYPLDMATWVIYDVICPQCHCHERHRMLQEYFTREGRGFLPESGRALHFAPEDCVREIIGEREGLQYFIADRDRQILEGKNAPGFRTDMLALAVKDGSIDFIFCSHVLEHVRDDHKAVGELYRALKPGGRAVIMVPFDEAAESTVEWEHAREEMFEHVRAYSRKDFTSRLSPFEVEEVAPEVFLSEAERKRYGIPPKEVIYLCRKQIM